MTTKHDLGDTAEVGPSRVVMRVIGDSDLRGCGCYRRSYTDFDAGTYELQITYCPAHQRDLRPGTWHGDPQPPTRRERAQHPRVPPPYQG